MRDHIFVISLGGSLIVPDKVNHAYPRNFSGLVRKYVRRGHRFIIICGGGAVCRQYLAAARTLGVRDSRALDRIGIASTYLNAQLVLEHFGSLAYEKVLMSYSRLPVTRKPIMVGGGWEPGSSTDLDAVIAAELAKASLVINCSDVTYVYDRDPDTHPAAKPQRHIRWREFIKMMGPYRPGGNYPFDPIAAKRAQRAGITVVVCKGKNLANLERILEGKSFVGTRLW